jgi:CheY-like chemotaxis protein
MTWVSGFEARYPAWICGERRIAMLRSTGYEVAVAENGRRAVDLFREREGRFALVLLDLTMPVMGGPQTIRHLKKCVPKFR